MMNFDRVADVYDATRGLPDDVAERVTDRILAATNAGHDAAFLEIGVGTGRIALPLVKRGYRFTGIDISEKMIGHFREKVGDAPNLTLVQTDVTNLPVPDGSQDVVLAIHILHLVPEWQKALREVRRVLKSNGHFVWGGNDMPPEHPGAVIRRQWTAFVREMGGELRPRYADWEHIQEETAEADARTACYRVARWASELRPIDLINALHARTFSAGWTVSQDILDAVHDKLLVWSREQFGILEQPLRAYEEFTLFVTRWP